MMAFFRSLTPTGIKVLAGLALALIVAGVLVWNAWGAARTATTEARLSTNQTGAALASGADAVASVGQTHAAEVTIDIITEENARAIREAPGAAAPVDPALDAAARRGLCRHAAYRGKPECLQQPAPR